MYININYKLFDIFRFVLDIIDDVGKFTYLNNNFKSLIQGCKRQGLSIELEDLR